MDLINTEEWMFFITIAFLAGCIAGYVFGMLDGKENKKEIKNVSM